MSKLYYIKRKLCYYYFKIFKSTRTFIFKKEKYNYFYHMYSSSWSNERAIEIPIIKKILERYNDKKILEVGNVISNYFNVTHDIIDKYEKAKGVINQDIVDFKPRKKYDLIISISTLEHVGFDEKLKEPRKILRVIKNLKSLLKPGGKIIITLPLGYNLEMDKLLREKKLGFIERYYFKKLSRDNKWIQTDWENVKDLKYNKPFLCANGLFIGIIKI